MLQLIINHNISEAGLTYRHKFNLIISIYNKWSQIDRDRDRDQFWKNERWSQKIDRDHNLQSDRDRDQKYCDRIQPCLALI